MPRWYENPHPDLWANMKEAASVLGVHHMAARNVLKGAAVPTFLYKGVCYVTLADLNQFAKTYPKQSWTASEIRLLKTMWGYHPISAIAERLGRTATAVDVKSKRLKLYSPVTWPGVLTEYRLAPLLGLDRKTVWRHMQPGGIFPAITLYKSETPVLIVYEDTMANWLGDFKNWIYFRDVRDITHPPFAEAIQRTRERLSDDRWLMPKEAADLIGVPVRTLNAKIRRGAIPATRYQYWRVRRSDALRYRETINYHKRWGTSHD